MSPIEQSYVLVRGDVVDGVLPKKATVSRADFLAVMKGFADYDLTILVDGEHACASWRDLATGEVHTAATSKYPFRPDNAAHLRANAASAMVALALRPEGLTDIQAFRLGNPGSDQVSPDSAKAAFRKGLAAIGAPGEVAERRDIARSTAPDGTTTYCLRPGVGLDPAGGKRASRVAIGMQLTRVRAAEPPPVQKNEDRAVADDRSANGNALQPRGQKVTAEVGPLPPPQPQSPPVEVATRPRIYDTWQPCCGDYWDPEHTVLVPKAYDPPISATALDVTILIRNFLVDLRHRDVVVQMEVTHKEGTGPYHAFVWVAIVASRWNIQTFLVDVSHVAGQRLYCAVTQPERDEERGFDIPPGGKSNSFVATWHWPFTDPLVPGEIQIGYKIEKGERRVIGPIDARPFVVQPKIRCPKPK